MNEGGGVYKAQVKIGDSDKGNIVDQRPAGEQGREGDNERQENYSTTVITCEGHLITNCMRFIIDALCL